jgi:carboxymethylenebutenolidase
MIEKKIDIKTPDGVADAYLYAPEPGGAWPGVIMYVDAMGVRGTFQDMARRLAGEGFAVLLPNVYYRSGRLPLADHDLNITDEKDKAVIQQLMGKLTPEAMRKDGAAYVDALAGESVVKRGKVGVVGFCMSGAMAVRTAAVRPDRVGAAASFHGGRLATDDPESPHRLAPQIKAQLYFGFATEDQSMPEEAIKKLRAALDDAGARYASDVYDGARHGWVVKDHRMYNPAQAERAWKHMLALFKEALR